MFFPSSRPIKPALRHAITPPRAKAIVAKELRFEAPFYKSILLA